MHVVKHLYVLTHGSTYCTCGVLTVAPPVGVCAHVLDSYMGMHGPVGVATLVCMGSATDQGLWFGGWGCRLTDEAKTAGNWQLP